MTKKKEIDLLKKKLAAIEAQSDVLETELRQLSEQENTIKHRLAFLEWGVAPGVLVRRTCNDPFNTGAIVKVVEVEIGYSKPWIKGFHRKPDGTFYKHLRSLYGDWELA